MRCDIIIPIWNQLESTKQCIEAIVRSTGYPYRLILIDNGSDSQTKLYLEGLKVNKPNDIIIIRNSSNLGYIKAVNQGLKASDAPYVCLMNNDTIPGVGWLERLISFAQAHKDIGLLNPLCGGHGDLAIDEYAAKVAGNGDRYMEMNQCFGFCTLVKREVIEKIGYLDEVFGIGGYDDTDYSRRAGQAGYFCACVHSSYVYHKEHVSFNALGVKDSATSKGHQEYLKKWPRHLRIGMTFSIGANTPDVQIANMLKTVLSLARQWCWVNLWIFGDEESAKCRIDAVSKSIGMPLHQNIKFVFMPGRFTKFQVLARLIERSFGTKKRKKYDVVFSDDERMESFLNLFHPVHTTRVILLKAGIQEETQSWREFLLQAARGS